LNRGSHGILAKGRAISREDVISYVYSRGAASASYGIVRDEAFQY
jgi:hypothetical protein